MSKRKLIRKLRKILLNNKLLLFSLILVLVLDFLPEDWSQKKAFGNLQLLLALYFFSSSTFLVLEKLKKIKRLIQGLIILAQAVIILPAVIFFVLRFENLPETVESLLTLLFFSSFFTLAIFVLKHVFFFLKKSRLFSFLKRNRKFVEIAFLFVLLAIFSKYCYSLEKRVAKLEHIAGPKKILCDEKESIEKMKKSLVRIVGTQAEGSGFFVTPTGFIATNYHVIRNDPSPKIIMLDYSFIQGEVMMADKQSDLAFVKIYGKEKLPTVTFADSDQIEPMEELISIGYPLGTVLRGEASAVKGRFVALRTDPKMGLNLVQTDMTLNPGSSGGPMINLCGEVVAINAVGLAGLGMGISANDFNRRWLEMAAAEEPLKDVKQITVNPNGSLKECVEAFYNYQTIGKLEEAFNLLTKNYTDWPFEKWKEGYKNTLNILLYETEEVEENKVYVKFSSADLEGEDIVYRFFEGTLEVIEVDGELKLDKHDIEEIKKPSWDWFYSLPE